MTIRLKIGVCTALAAFALSACGGGGSYGDGGVIVIPPPPPANSEDRFGTGFGAIFRAPANSDSAEPAANFIIPLDLTTDSLPIN